MAITLTELRVLIGGDASDLKNDLDDATKTTTNWASSLGGAVTKLVGGAIVGGAAAAAAGIASIGKAAFDVRKETQLVANDIAASLGIPISEAERFAEVAKRVYGNNFADSIQDAGQAVEFLAQQMDGLDDGQLQAAAEDAFALRDVFGIDVNESIDAAKTLMDNFGVSAEEAFDLIAAGQQKGLNRSGDFLDTIGEYSVQFATGGASANQFFQFLENGLQGGVLGTDKAADAFKEFQIRLLSGSTKVGSALDELEGTIDSGIFNSIRDGSVSSVEAFDLVLEGIRKIEDPIRRNNVSVELLGTQFEDLADIAGTQLGFVGDSFKDIEQATESLSIKYNDFGTFFSGLWRRAAISVEPFISKLLELVNDNLPALDHAFEFFEGSIIPVLNEQLVPAVGRIIDLFARFAENLSGDLGPTTQRLGDILISVASSALGLAKSFGERVLPPVMQVLSAFGRLYALYAEEVLPIVLGVIGAFVDLAGTLAEKVAPTISTLIDTFTQLVGSISLTGSVTELTDGVSSASSTFDTFKSKIETVKGAVTGFIETLLDAGKLIAFLITTEEIDGFVTANLLPLDRYKAWFDDNLPRIQSIVTKTLTAIQKFWDKWGDSILKIVTVVFANVKLIIDLAIQTILDLVTLGLQLLNGEWEAAGETLAGIIRRLWETIISIFQNSIDAVIAIIQDVDWAELGRNAMNSLLDGIKAVGNAIVLFLRGLVGDMANEFTNIDWSQIGRNIVTSLRSGFDAAWTSFSQWFRNQLSGLSNLIPDFGGFFGGGGVGGQSVGSSLFGSQSVGDALGLNSGSTFVPALPQGAVETISNLTNSSAVTDARQTVINVYNQIAAGSDLNSVRNATRLGVLDAARAAGI